MKTLTTALERLIDGFDGFTEELRSIVDDMPRGGNEAVVGYGEEPDDDEFVQKAPDRGGVNDDTTITMRSGDLREVIDAYRTLSRLAREGRIPTQDQRLKLHRHIKKVKHLVRAPIR